MDAPRRRQTSAERLITVLTRSRPTSQIRGCAPALIPNAALGDKCLLCSAWCVAVALVHAHSQSGAAVRLASLPGLASREPISFHLSNVGGDARGDPHQPAGTLALNCVSVEARTRSPLCHRSPLRGHSHTAGGYSYLVKRGEIHWARQRFTSPIFFLFIKICSSL